MTIESTLQNKASRFFEKDTENLAIVPLHKWLFISASILIFVVLPLLFIWSSLGIIHPPVNGQDGLFSDKGNHVEKISRLART